MNWPKPSRLAGPGRIFGSTSGIWAESADRVYVSVRGEIVLPKNVNGRPVPPNFTGAFGALGAQATSQVPDMRNCILVIDRNGAIVEAWTQWDHLFQDGRGPHQVIMSPYDPERAVWVVDVSDIESPRKVAEYTVPEGGAHNIWVEDDILFS